MRFLGFSTNHGGRRNCILARVEATHPLKVVYPVGTHQPCNHGAPGKLLLAYNYTDDNIRELLRTGKIKTLTEKTKTDFRYSNRNFARFGGWVMRRAMVSRCAGRLGFHQQSLGRAEEVISPGGHLDFDSSRQKKGKPQCPKADSLPTGASSLRFATLQ
jgi:hypothetical protein